MLGALAAVSAGVSRGGCCSRCWSGYPIAAGAARAAARRRRHLSHRRRRHRRAVPHLAAARLGAGPAGDQGSVAAAGDRRAGACSLLILLFANWFLERQHAGAGAALSELRAHGDDLPGAGHRAAAERVQPAGRLQDARRSTPSSPSRCTPARSSWAGSSASRSSPRRCWRSWACAATSSWCGRSTTRTASTSTSLDERRRRRRRSDRPRRHRRPRTPATATTSRSTPTATGQTLDGQRPHARRSSRTATATACRARWATSGPACRSTASCGSSTAAAQAKNTGISVGNEWTYRSFIDGNTPATAIWTFDNIDESGLDPERRRCRWR